MEAGHAGLSAHVFRRSPAGAAHELTEAAFEHWCFYWACVWGIFFRAFLTQEAFIQMHPFLTQDDCTAVTEKAVHLAEHSEVGRASSLTAAGMRDSLAQSKLKFAGDWEQLDPLLLHKWQDTARELLDEEKQDAEVVWRLLNGWVDPGLHDYSRLLRLPDWDWGLFDRLDVLAAMQSWDFERQTWAIAEGAPGSPLSIYSALRGDIETASRGLDWNLEMCQRLSAKQDGAHGVRMKHSLMLALMLNHLPLALITLGRLDDAAQLMTETGATWATADALADAQQKRDNGLRKRGSTKAAWWCVEGASWFVKLQYVLCTTWREVDPAEVIAALPSPDVLHGYVCPDSSNHDRHFQLRQGSGSLTLLAAQVCEKLEKPEDALRYVAKATRVDDADPTADMRPTTHAIGHALRGRILNSQGKTAEAEAAFEQAIEVSHRTGLRLYEMFALRDLKKHILDPDGRGDEGTRRLKAVLAEMKGPPAELTKLLGGDLDAEAILRS